MGAPRLTPVPVSVAGRGETEDVKLTLTVAVKLPAAAGVKVTLMAQLPPAAIDAQVLVWEKSPGLAPWRVIADTCTAKEPTFETVMICAGLEVPIVWLPKVTLLGDKLVTVPVPDRDTPWGLPPALSVTIREPLTVPFAFGVKETEIAQLAPAARLAVQLLV
jgi:hypothetical protein